LVFRYLAAVKTFILTANNIIDGYDG